mmetsp:Transcript_9683/g.31537  ORF Transcript_9683/g.31537 Transcript_9683/m.31537 type:complete len:540 (-) Transcript_9683:87-1706(-)
MGSYGEIKAAMEGTLDYWAIRRAVKEEVIKPKYDVDHLEEDVVAMMERSGLATRLRNAALTLHERLEGGAAGGSGRGSEHDRRAAPKAEGEQEMLDAFQSTRQNWAQFVVDSLNEISVKSTHPIACRERLVPPGPCVLAVMELDLEQAPGVTGPVKAQVYSLLDLLQAMEGIRPKRRTLNSKASGGQRDGGVRPPAWGMLRVELATPTLEWMRLHYRDLGLETRQIGLDDEIHPWFLEEQARAGAKAAAGGSIPVCRQFARTGVPAELRPLVWRVALGQSEVNDKDRLYFDRLCQEVLRRRLLVDGMVCADIKSLSDDDEYFIFEEVLRAAMLAMTRDSAVGPACAVAPFPRLRGMGRKGRSHGSYPPSGVLPFEKMCHFAAPLSYLYQEPEELYFTFRALYTRHLCRLHALSPDAAPAPSLPVLCKTFEDLLQRLDAEVVFHLAALGCRPLSIAFPWISQAFVSHLDAAQVLLLWDRIIGFDSLLPLALMAAALFVFRRASVMACATPEDVRESFADLSDVRVVPLLQGVLFAGAELF